MYDLLTELAPNGLMDISNLLLAVSTGDAAGVAAHGAAVNADLKAAAAKGRESAELVFLDTFRSLYRTYLESGDANIRTADIQGSESFRAVCALTLDGVFPYELDALTDIFEALVQEKYGHEGITEELAAVLRGRVDTLHADYHILRYAIDRALLNREIRLGTFDAVVLRELTESLNALAQYQDEGLTLLTML